MVRIGITAIHAAVPICIVSPHVPNNVAFAAIPWFLASYSAYLPTEQFTLKQWIQALYDTVVDRTGQTSHAFGLIKMARGLAKLVLLYVGVQPLLPTMPDAMLNYPWFSSESLSYTFLFGVKAYLVLGCADVTAGLAQALTGWRMVDMFDSPILATSPIDFWR
ncbi:uncharacterized protein B0P05DRAFT_461922 [Gilbertella persicaria]|uniref:uncharacterized protein n=1 Tax=Gilbertella persicaria TaxID=101096 RepID=UPI002220CE5B|nr:uncharacterized protein B0P05DRAFT_461922 [Gilbertella persicaria]KAI8094983.1 hypothetical protein B0P05DRAFT_461922 [Gilbertella persicaria]